MFVLSRQKVASETIHTHTQIQAAFLTNPHSYSLPFCTSSGSLSEAGQTDRQQEKNPCVDPDAWREKK